ncbi:hypothetical protein HK405_006334 [Cladochytrium tenue]|nr:hypothetical protein HK405_006334 [Cladochytrium tenue]
MVEKRIPNETSLNAQEAIKSNLMSVEGKGITISVGVDVDFESATHTITAHKVEVAPDNLQLRISGSRKESMLKLVNKTITDILRKELSDAFGERVLSAVDALDRRLTELKPELKALSRLARDAAAQVSLRRRATSAGRGCGVPRQVEHAALG